MTQRCHPGLEDRERYTACKLPEVCIHLGLRPGSGLARTRTDSVPVFATVSRRPSLGSLRLSLRNLAYQRAESKEGKQRNSLSRPTPIGFLSWLATLAVMVRTTVALLSQENPESSTVPHTTQLQLTQLQISTSSWNFNGQVRRVCRLSSEGELR